jgi:hypothetical protein
MNEARWALAYHGLLEQDKQELQRWAIFCGTLAAHPDEEGDTVRVIPLGAVINAEVLKELHEQAPDALPESTTDPDYEAMVEDLAKGGALTILDTVQPSIETGKQEWNRKRAKVILVDDTGLDKPSDPV